jgi:8-amino-7-oxononanoate synthase
MNADKTEKKLPTLFDKCYDYRYADDVKAAGIYPYFRPIEESEGPVVRMDGKKLLWRVPIIIWV